jgi:alpha-tubulin suppressor-like RCC1 family protein
VTDAKAVFSFGYSVVGALGQPRLVRKRGAATADRSPGANGGWWFVAVAAGDGHALALTEEGELYGWGHWGANGHGLALTPQRVAALIGVRVKLVHANYTCSCAVTEGGELFTCHLGRKFLFQPRPRRQYAPAHAEAGRGARRGQGRDGGDFRDSHTRGR